jgi:Histidine kinase
MKAKKLLLIIMACISSMNMHAQDGYVDSLMEWLKAHPKIDSLHIQTLHRVSYRLSEKDVKKSFSFYQKVSFLSDSMHFLYGKSLAQINLGILLYNSGNFDASNTAYFKAIDLADSCNALRLKAVSYNNIGENFKILKDYDKCREYAKEAIAINKPLNAFRGIAINYELLHECALNEKLYKESKNFLLDGMTYALKTDENYILSQYYVGFGKLEAIDNKLDSAVIYFNRAMNSAKQEGDLRNEYQAYLAEAKYLKNLNADKKIRLLDTALEIAKSTSYLEGLSNAAQELSSVYDEKKNKDSSLFFYRIYRSAADSLFSESNKRNVIIKEAEWTINRTEIENNDLKELAKLQQEEIGIKNILLVVSILSFLLILVIIFFINRSIQFKKKREEAAFKQRVAETQMMALKAQMSPHFIFNNFNSIENFLMRNDKQAAGSYFNKMGSLVNIIVDNINKERISISKDKAALELYIELQQLRYQNKFSYTTSFDKKLLSEDYQVPPLLIQPYVENAIVNSIGPSDKDDLELSIKARLDGEYIVYTIRDNGIGQKKMNGSLLHQNASNDTGTGIDIAEERINILNQQQHANGEVSVTDLYDNYGKPDGTRVEVTIKVV